jgi:hypothetical protein
MRLSAENADTARVIPQQEQARQQYYLDLFADDVALLERIKSMLGTQPVLEKEAVWTTFGKVFTVLDRSRITKPTELASTLEFAYEELKLCLGVFDVVCQMCEHFLPVPADQVTSNEFACLF